MAGRIRSIKPELLEDDKTAALSHEGWRCFVSLLLLADDYGNFRAHPALLDGAIFWGCPSAQGIGRLLRELGESGLVTIYSVRDQTYGHINGWARHQRVDKPGKPRCPGPKDAEKVLEYEDSRILPESFRTDLRSPISDHRPGPPRGGEAGTGVAMRLPPAPTSIHPEPKKKAHRLPPDWEPSAEVVAKMRDAFRVDPLQCLDAFRDWAASSPKAVKLDWDATFRSWVRREVADGKLEPLPPKQSQLGIDPNDTSGPATEASKRMLAEAMAKLTARIDEDNARMAAATGPARKY